MHLKSGPSKLLKLFAGDPASLALVTVKVEPLLTFPPPRWTGVVGAVEHVWAPPGERLPNNTMREGGWQAFGQFLFETTETAGA